ncbi:hypothetical protein ACIRF8_25995 [Streptomyces sp. NPDC102406]|uniref:hypothetical protein n=1 Tax=Streptomyces sp. NPDC102406 TaxID=3366171 RepID=UPI0038199346
MLRHRVMAGVAGVAIVAAGVIVPVSFAGSADAAPCWSVPARTRALADDPAAATSFLDPLDDTSRTGRVEGLLDHEAYCGDGARAVGRAIVAAASAAPGKPHTEAQARTAYAVMSVLSFRSGVPAPGLEPAVARVMAEYVVDVARTPWLSDDHEVTGPAEPAAGATALDEAGRTPFGSFLNPREAHAVFGHRDPLRRTRGAAFDGLISRLARNPEAFAVLYDAERAYFAYYLERLTNRGGDPAARPTARDEAEARKADSDRWRYDLTSPDQDLGAIAERIGMLTGLRTTLATDGTIEDLSAFDSAIREHTRGTYRPSARRVTTLPAMNTIAARAASGAVRGDLFDGRAQLYSVYDTWVRERGVPAGRAEQLRQLLDEQYMTGFWTASVQW